jgi:hypothetical protein
MMHLRYVLAPLSIAILLVAGPTLAAGNGGSSLPGSNGSFPAVDTGQTVCYDNRVAIPCPASGQPFAGQDAQFQGNAPRFTKSADGLTVHDDVTGLTWQKSPDTNGDGTIDSLDKMTLAQAQARPAVLNAAEYGGFGDWRLPTIKELYSLINFAGTDPSGLTGNDTSGLTPFIDRTYFDFGYGDTARGERIIDMQYASSTLYAYQVMLNSPAMFGVNFADGRIKGYSLDMSAQGPGESRFPVRLVRGAPYGANDFVDNADGTISDRATGLTWTKGDSPTGLNWQEALAWVQARNAESYLGHDDWRLPNAKELQGIVDYTRSPDTTSSAAIDPLFSCTEITNEAGKADFPFYWTGTTHASQGGGPDGSNTGGSAVYVAFGRALGYMTDPSSPSRAGWLDVHGAGAQRSDPKQGNPADFPHGRGPQGDAIRIYNYVRLVRGAGGAEASCPSVASVTPSSGAIGASVSIAGSGFTGVTAVKFANDVTASFTVWSDSLITTTVPAGAMTGPITLVTAGCPAAATPSFSVTAGGSACSGPYVYFVPAGAHAAGDNGTIWATDLALQNVGSGSQASVTIDLLERDQDNSNPASRAVTVARSQQLALPDVFLSKFGRSNIAAALKICSDQPLRIMSRTYNLASTGTFGQGIPGYLVERALAAGTTGNLMFLFEGTKFRTNVGLVNTEPTPVSVDVELFDSTGARLGTKSYSLRPYEYVQRSKIFTEATRSEVAAGSAIIRPTGGAVFGYASLIDNATGDPTFMNAE